MSGLFIGSVGQSTLNAVKDPKAAIQSTTAAVINTAKKPFEAPSKSKAE